MTGWCFYVLSSTGSLNSHWSTLVHYWEGSLPVIQGGKMTYPGSHSSGGPGLELSAFCSVFDTTALSHGGLYILLSGKTYTVSGWG